MPEKKPATPTQIVRFGHIAKALQAFLKGKDWTPSDLNEALGLPRSYASAFNWVNGKGAPSEKYLHKVSKLTGIPESALMINDLKRAKAIIPSHATVIMPSQTLPKPINSEVLSFAIASDGNARIRLDITLPMQLATPLFRMLLDAGLVFSKDDENATSNQTQG